MKRLALASLLVAGPAWAAPREDGTVPPPPGAPAMAVPARALLTWFGVQVSDPPAVHLQLSAEATIGTAVEGQTLIVTIAGVDLDPQKRWAKVDLRQFETMPISSIEVVRGSAGATVRLEFKPGIVPTATPSIASGTDGFTYVLVDLSAAVVVPATTPGLDSAEPAEPASTLPIDVERDDLGPLRRRDPFMLDLSIGAGVTVIRDDNETTQTEFAVSGLNLGLGGRLTDRTALVVRLSVASSHISLEQFDLDYVLTSVAATAGVQHYLSEANFIAAGLGVGQIFIDADRESDETGFALHLLAGTTWKLTQHGAYYLSAEVTPVKYPDAWHVTAAAQLGWQLF